MQRSIPVWRSSLRKRRQWHASRLHCRKEEAVHIVSSTGMSQRAAISCKCAAGGMLWLRLCLCSILLCRVPCLHMLMWARRLLQLLHAAGAAAFGHMRVGACLHTTRPWGSSSIR